MKRSNLRNKYLKSTSEEGRQRFVKQRNLCVSLLRKTKRSYYSNLKEKMSSIIKKKTTTNKCVNSEKITLADNEKIITNIKEIAKVLNVFSNILAPQTLKYRVGVQWGQSYIMGRRCLFSLDWPPF